IPPQHLGLSPIAPAIQPDFARGTAKAGALDHQHVPGSGRRRGHSCGRGEAGNLGGGMGGRVGQQQAGSERSSEGAERQTHGSSSLSQQMTGPMVDVTPGKEPLFRTAIGEDRERRAHNMMLMMADFLGMVGTLLLAAVLV